MTADAKDLMTAGRLDEARSQLTAEVKAAPTDTGKRTLLFQVLAFLGEWEKAERHLDMIGTLNPSSRTGADVLRNCVAAEKARREVLDGNTVPGLLSSEPPYLETCLLAARKAAAGELNEARTLCDLTRRNLPELKGTLNGKEFTGFCDTDVYLSPFLEVIMHDRYLWVPFDVTAELSISPPQTFLDLLWTPARLATWEGVHVQCYLPVLYPGSFRHGDDRIRLGRMTDWLETGRAVGQHVYQVGDEDISLLEIGDMVFARPEG